MERNPYNEASVGDSPRRLAFLAVRGVIGSNVLLVSAASVPSMPVEIRLNLDNVERYAGTS